MAEEPSGFLGRWARRKTDVLQGKPLQEPAIAEKPVPPAIASVQPVSATPLVPSAASLKEPPEAPATAQPAEKLLSLEDVKTLTQESDFTPFMARNVGPEVRNAAMKKLFADPQFNVMDGLDIYIDDYSKSDPIPESMLRQMASAKFLNLFEEEDVEKNESQEASQASAVAPGDAASRVDADPNHLDAETVAHSGASSELDAQEAFPADSSSQHDHAHSHLRLQPDHAAPAPHAGRGT